MRVYGLNFCLVKRGAIKKLSSLFSFFNLVKMLGRRSLLFSFFNLVKMFGRRSLLFSFFNLVKMLGRNSIIIYKFSIPFMPVGASFIEKSSVCYIISDQRLFRLGTLRFWPRSNKTML